MSLTNEHDYEPIPGLPELLPQGEFVRWQGAPDWKDLALTGLHVRKLAIYFVVLLIARVVVQGAAGTPLGDTLASTAVLAVMAALALGFLALYAWMSGRTTRYTITNRRLVIRSGVTLPMTVNLPFGLVESADLKVRKNGRGDLPVTLAPAQRPSWIVLWPHVKPWSVGRVRPMLRSVPKAQSVGELLADNLREFHGATTQRSTAPAVTRGGAPDLPNSLSPSAG